ncbi:MAG: sugar phosphate nucleotidyltransferase [bacterium]
MKLVILAGGSGSRLWPLSKKNSPKQLQVILGDSTLLQKTYERLRLEFDSRDIYIATGHDQAESIKNQLPDLAESQLILEPMRRDTAAAIGLAAITIGKMFPDEIMININSDHFIKDEAKYLRAIRLVEKIILERAEFGVLIGVKPTYPETGYGYIKMGEEMHDYGEFKTFNLDSFKEKPNIEKAKEYFEQWEYLWNIGCFAWKIEVLLALFKEHLPKMSTHLLNIQEAIGGINHAKVLLTEFSAIEPISMDYGIVEKVSKLLVIPADFGWADIGHWKTVKDVLSEAQTDNVIKGQVVAIDSNNNLAYSYTGKLIALVGVNDLVVVENGDSILVCAKEQAQDVKKITDSLKESGLEQYL